jgi:hypothetical protein
MASASMRGFYALRSWCHEHPRAAASSLARAPSSRRTASHTVELAIRRDGQVLPRHHWAPSPRNFRASYGLNGTILGLPGSRAHLEIVGLRDGPPPTPGRDDLVFYLPDAAARDHIVARLASAGVRPVAQIDYWEDNGGVTFEDPDGRKVVFVSWIYGQ